MSERRSRGRNAGRQNPRWQSMRPKLLAVAVHILGSVHDAEDVVSEAWLRLEEKTAEAGNPEVRNPEAWLIRVVSNLAVDAATTAERRRTDYVGPWLPEYVSAGAATAPLSADAASAAVLRESVDLAVVRLLQELRPIDRAAVVLVDVAGLSHAEAAEVIGATPSAMRQRISRARRVVRSAEGTPPATVDRETLDAIAASLASGDLSAFTELISEGCVLWTDSGGHTRAARRPVHGRDKVVRFLRGIIGKYGMPTLDTVDLLGGAALRATSPDMVRGIVLEHVGGRITGIQVQQNADKLQIE